jgi:hypothetical protein
MANFLIVGANKVYNLSLYYYHIDHPQIYLPNDGESMFSNHYYNKSESDSKFRTSRIVTLMASYNQLFFNLKNEGIPIGEAYTSCVGNPNRPETIFDNNLKMKIIISLRNLIERAFSNYLIYIKFRKKTLVIRFVSIQNILLYYRGKYLELVPYNIAVQKYSNRF